MSVASIRYQFTPGPPFGDVEGALVVAALAVEILFGTEPVQRDAICRTDELTRCCVIDVSTDVGRALNRLFVGFLHRDVGMEAFTVEPSVAFQPPRGMTGE
jgi:hypothetical protein